MFDIRKLAMAEVEDQFDQSRSTAHKEQIDHRLIHKKANAMASLLNNARTKGLDPYLLLSAYATEIDRIGMPSDTISNTRRWFGKKLLRDARQRMDMEAHNRKEIGDGKMLIVSDNVLQSRREQTREHLRFMKNNELQLKNEAGEETRIPLNEVYNNPQKRAAKHYVRTLGLQEFFSEQGYKALFVTLTLPSEYHPNPAKGKKSWNGLSPEEGHIEMQDRWRRLQKRFGKLIGVRVEEPHKDGCIHWHMLIWILTERMEEFERKLTKYFGGAPAAVIMEIDSSIASPATYIMKYIIPALGNGEGAAQQDRENAERADAHRATWGGRAIQVFDFPGTGTVWDEIRRVKADSREYKSLTPKGKSLYEAAVGNDYCGFLHAFQDLRGADKQDGCKVVYGKNKHGAKFIEGICIDKIHIRTHSGDWKIVPKKAVTSS